MNEFNNSLKGELYKLSRKKRLLKLAIGIVALIVIFTSIFAFLGVELLGIIDGSGMLGNQSMDNDEAISAYNQALDEINAKMGSEEYKKLNIWGKRAVKNQAYVIKANIAKYNYLKKHNKVESDFAAYGSNNTKIITYMDELMGIAFMIISLYAIVKASDNIVGENKKGVLKMQLTRPTSRAKTFTAKYMSIFIVSASFLFVTAIVLLTVGLILFGGSAKDILYVIDAKFVGTISPFAMLILKYFVNLFTIFALMQFTYFMASISNYKVGVAFPIIMYLFLGSLIESVLSFVFVGYVGFFGNLGFLNSLAIGGAPNFEIGLWAMILISLIWVGGMTAYNYVKFKRHDFA